MTENIHIQPTRTRRFGSRPFIVGLSSVLVLGFVFFAGIQIGAGRWSVSFSNRVVQENAGMVDDLDYASVESVYDELRQKYDGKLDEAKLLAGLKKGLAEAAGDPYTTYMDASETKNFNEQLSGSFSGIGAELGKEGSNIVVVSPIAGFPAEKAGLKSKDVIISIDGQDATNLSVDEAVTRIRGTEGTTVKLVVIRDSKDRVELSITRGVINIPSVESKTLDGGVGYIRISRFSGDTVELAQKAAQDFRSNNIDKIILDLRGNPGGYLNAAVGLSDIWLGKDELIVQEKRDDKVVESFSAKLGGTLTGIKTVVLVDGGSASASEIAAGALKDNKVAQVVGTKTYGKGSVQEVANLSDGGILKVTVARWYTPSGKNIDKEGITPDIVVTPTDADIAAKKDVQLEKAQQLLQ